MPSFYGVTTNCNCEHVHNKLGPPPIFNLKPPPALDPHAFAELGHFKYYLSLLTPSSSNSTISASSHQPPQVIVAKTSPPELMPEPLLLITCITIIVLIFLLLFFIFIAIILVRMSRNKLIKSSNRNTEHKDSPTNSNRNYLISNSSTSDNSSNLSEITSASHKTNTVHRDQFLCQQFYPSELSSSNSTSSSSASPKSSSLNTSYLNDHTTQQKQHHSTNSSKLINASTSTSSSFCDSQSFLTNTNQFKQLPNPVPISFVSNPDLNPLWHQSQDNAPALTRQTIHLIDEDGQNQYESIPDLSSQVYFDVDATRALNTRSNQMILTTGGFNNTNNHGMNMISHTMSRRFITQPALCQCYGNNGQHSSDCPLLIQHQIQIFNRINNNNFTEGNYLNSLIV